MRDPSPRRKPHDPHHLGPVYTWERIPPAAEENLGLLYHENTKRYLAASDEGPRTASVPVRLAGKELVVSKHILPPDSARIVRLPSSEPDPRGPSVADAIVARRSWRAFRKDALSLREVSAILGLAYGVTARAQTEHGELLLRAVPSGGARYPLEIYVAVRAVDGLAQGVYHYRPEPHVLEPVSEGDCVGALHQASLGSDAARQAAMSVVLTAVWHRNMDKYGERGYRGVLMEAGAVIQNIHLAAESLSLGAVALEGIDEAYDRLVQADGFDESSLLSVAVGRKAAEPDGALPI